MCIGIPGKIITIKGKRAKIKQGKHCHWVDISFLSDKIQRGDYLITYQETAVNKISLKDAQEIWQLMNSAGDAGIKSLD